MFVPLVHPPLDLDPTGSRWIVIDRHQRILLVDGSFPVGPESPVAGSEVHLLGMADGFAVWTVRALSEDSETVSGDWVSLRDLFGRVSDADWGLAGRASQVLVWERDHVFCGRCGAETLHHPIDRARRCPECELTAFPRISPAVIMLVERTGPEGPEILLAWGRQFTERFFSVLAGFLEPGESLEECVVREVFEETQIVVDEVSYFGSQPWPFPHSLMVGFTARYVSGEIKIQEEEIVEAGWFGPDKLPALPTRGMSISSWLVDDWLRRVTR